MAPKMKKPAAAEDAPLPKGTEAKKRPSGSPSEEGLEPLRKKASLAKGAGLTDEKLQALKEMSLKEKVAAIAAENPEDVEAATEALGQVVTPAEKQGLWQKHKTYLNNNPSEKGEHEQLSKKEKGEAILSWFLRKSPTYAVEKHSREAKSTLERKDKWLSQKQVDGKWTEAEQGMLIESGRLIWREDPTTPGLYEYKDTQDFVGRHSVSDRSSWERVKEEQLADEKSWEDALGKDLGAFLRKVSLSKGLGKGSADQGETSFAKGHGKATAKAKTKAKAKARALALEDGQADDPPTKEEQAKEALAKARKMRDLISSTTSNLEEALTKAKGSQWVSQGHISEANAILKSLEREMQQMKQHIADPNVDVQELKKAMLGSAAVVKEAKDEVREIMSLSSKASSRASGAK